MNKNEKRIISKHMSRLGKEGGKATGPRKARTTKQARAAANVRWGKPSPGD